MGQLLSAKCNSEARLDGKVALVTGANTGIGKETAKDFYVRGATVILACRNITKANDTVDDIKKQCENKQNLGQLRVVELDLSSIKSVKACAQNLLKTEKNLNILVNNAGVFGIPYSKTEDGYEMNFQANHLGHFLLTLLLMPLLIKSTPARIVNVSSNLHKIAGNDMSDVNWEKRKYGSLTAYGETKLYNILFTKELVRKLKENNIEGISVYSLHPGTVKTDVGRSLDETYFPGTYFLWAYVFSIFSKNPEQGAQTTIYCSVDEKCAKETGLYYTECAVTEPTSYAKDEKAAKNLWDLSLKYAGLPENYNAFKKN